MYRLRRVSSRTGGLPLAAITFTPLDPAGDRMPAVVARQIESWLPFYLPEASADG